MSESDCRLDPYIISDLKGIDIFDLERKTWKGRLGVKDNVLIGYVEAVVPYPPSDAHSVLMHGTLDRLVFRSQYIAMPEVESVLDLSLVHHNPKLRHLDISVQEGQVFQQLELLRKTWRGDDQLLVDVSENAGQTDDRKIATVVIRNKVPKTWASASVNLDPTGVLPCGRRRPVVVDVLYWNRDYVTGVLKDKDAAILDTASRLFPSILTKLRLDTSRLTRKGLASVEKVLRRSTLEHLHIQCVPYSAWQEKSLGQVMGAVQWPTISSLSLTGNNIEGWIQLFCKAKELSGSGFAPRLLRLDIIGSSITYQQLSHESALTIHRLVYGSEVVELRLDNVRMQDGKDWELIGRASGWPLRG